MADHPTRYKGAGDGEPWPPEAVAARTLIAIIDWMERTPGLEEYRNAIFAVMTRKGAAKRTRYNKEVIYGFSGKDLAESMKPKESN
jgi:hypothetical protein